jgi:hypothetical protein
MVAALDTYSPLKRSAFIIMERILPPAQSSTLIRRSVATTVRKRLHFRAIMLLSFIDDFDTTAD